MTPSSSHSRKEGLSNCVVPHGIKMHYLNEYYRV
jgi:hypothetical protein